MCCREITLALEMLGISPTEDMDMVAQIKGEVRKLCNKTTIAAQITLNDKDQETRENVERMIYVSPNQKVSYVYKLVQWNPSFKTDPTFPKKPLSHILQKLDSSILIQN